MKKFLLISLLAVLGMEASAQTYTMKITTVDGSVVRIKASELDSVVFEPVVLRSPAGTFDGWTSASATYFKNMMNDGDTVTVTADDEEKTYRVVYTGKTWGTATFEGVTFTEDDTHFSYTGEKEGKILMPGMGGGEAKEYAAVLKSVSINKDGSAYTVELSAPSVMGGTTITFKEGVSPTAASDYAGWTNATSRYFPNGMASDGDKVTVTVATDGKAQVVYTSATWGTATFKDLTFTEGEDGYSFSGEAEGTILMPSMGGGASTEYAALFKSATISKNKKQFKFVFSAPSVMGGTTMNFQNGAAPKDDSAKAKRIMMEHL